MIASALVTAWWLKRPGPEAAAAYETTPVERRSIEAKVTATGTLSALVTVQVGSQVSGRIQEILVDYNSPVKKGQVIARIDPQLYQAAVERSRASVLVAKANLQRAKVEAENARRQAARSKELRDKQFIAQAELETSEASAASAQTQVASAEASLSQAQAALNEAEVNLKYTTIVSPTDGIVISRSVDVGQTVAASLQAPTLFTIAEDLRKMQVDTSVGEADVGRLQPGMRAAFTVDAYPGERFEGTIRQIRNAAQTVQNVVTYDAVIDLENPELKLKPGMTANVTIITAQRPDALAVPNAGLRFRPAATTAASGPVPAAGQKAGGKTLFVLRDGQAAPVPVKTGLTDGSVTEVVEGELREGDRIITAMATGAQGSAATKSPQQAGKPPGMRGPF
ncbi:efflux RND transporter periplasmic adaptor subunit [Hyalangium minutum]|uniref:Macrolide-specific efflux protein MacA n=1 Tax=Hyalangium minutum TaxID=394096 RepID=A0A085WB06_9BACT|nr:efflux RND transporter periplasmic adaptor subunit [Hyalangium minutum]KFE64869.1 Macrolide-specific efflux protein MacA [Hyalangium minutum]